MSIESVLVGLIAAGLGYYAVTHFMRTGKAA